MGINKLMNFSAFGGAKGRLWWNGWNGLKWVKSSVNAGLGRFWSFLAPVQPLQHGLPDIDMWKLFRAPSSSPNLNGLCQLLQMKVRSEDCNCGGSIQRSWYHKCRWSLVHKAIATWLNGLHTVLHDSSRALRRRGPQVSVHMQTCWNCKDNLRVAVLTRLIPQYPWQISLVRSQRLVLQFILHFCIVRIPGWLFIQQRHRRIGGGQGVLTAGMWWGLTQVQIMLLEFLEWTPLAETQFVR